MVATHKNLLSRNNIIAVLLMVAALSCQNEKTTIVTHGSFKKIADSRMYYESTGEGDAIVFLHGGFMDRRMWDKQVAYFSPDFKVITIDMRGHGMTVDGDSSYYMYEAIKLLMDSLHITKTTVVGLSLGGIVATDLALEYPAYVDKLVLVTPGIHGWTKEVPQDSILSKNSDLMRKAIIEQNDSALAAELFIRSWFDGPYRRSDETDTVERRKAVTMATETVKKHKLQSWPRYAAKPATGRLHAIKAPVLLIQGEKDNYAIKLNLDTLMTSIPQAKRTMVRDVAHMPNMERASEFNEMLMDFIRTKK